MLNRLRFLKRLAIDLPRQARLAYCLMRDARVPMRTKIAFGAGIAVIVTPFVDLPAAIPVVGELDMVALSLLAMRLFIAACPDDVVRSGERIASMISRRFDHADASSDQPVYSSQTASPSAPEHTGVGA